MINTLARENTMYVQSRKVTNHKMNQLIFHIRDSACSLSLALSQLKSRLFTRKLINRKHANIVSLTPTTWLYGRELWSRIKQLLDRLNYIFAQIFIVLTGSIFTDDPLNHQWEVRAGVVKTTGSQLFGLSAVTLHSWSWLNYTVITVKSEHTDMTQVFSDLHFQGMSYCISVCSQQEKKK